MTLIRRSFGLLAAFAFFAFATASQAQEASPAAPTFPEAKLEAFADAAVNVSHVMRSWREKVQGAQSDAEQTAMIEQANQEIEQAINATDGITLDEYQAIAAAAQKDPEFAEQLKARVLAKIRATTTPPQP